MNKQTKTTKANAAPTAPATNELETSMNTTTPTAPAPTAPATLGDILTANANAAKAATDATDSAYADAATKADDQEGQDEQVDVVTYYDDKGITQGTIATRPVTVEDLRKHANTDSEMAASLLFRSLIDPRLFDAFRADVIHSNSTGKKGTALSDLVDSRTLAAQLTPVLRWYVYQSGNLFSAWSARTAERQTRPTLSGIASFASSELGGGSTKTTASDAIMEAYVMLKQRISPLEKLGENDPMLAKVFTRCSEVLNGDALSPESKKIWRKAIKPKAK